MKELKFSNNWNNKLNCKYFTTLRLSNRFEIGDKVSVFFKDKKIGVAEIVGKKKKNIVEIDEFISGIDTGYSWEETRDILMKMYKMPEYEQWEDVIIYLYLLKMEEKQQNI